MVLYDVSDDADLVKVASSIVGTDVLLERNQDGLNVLSAPHGLKARVRPAQRGQIEDHFLPEVVIEAEELALAEVLRCEKI